MTGFVYFLRCGDFVKIGFSAQPKRRLRHLQTATPFDFELLGMHPGLRWQEQQLHKIFASLRHRHEWFRVDQTILDIAATGLPSMDADRAQPAPSGLRPATRHRAARILASYLDQTGVTQEQFAERFGVNKSTVTYWVQRHLPAERAMEIERATGIPRFKLRPDIYPEPAPQTEVAAE